MLMLRKKYQSGSYGHSLRSLSPRCVNHYLRWCVAGKFDAALLFEIQKARSPSAQV